MEDTSRRTMLVVIFGGRSAEHDVSCVTAAHVMKAIDRSRFDAVAIGIARDGTWHRSEVPVDAMRFEAHGSPVTPDALIELATMWPVVVVPLVHGPLGEDGTLQGLCEILDVPYVGSGVLASAVAMDKGIAKSLFAAASLPQVRHAAHREDRLDDTTLDAIATDLGFPLFVKPANMGSSVGVSKASDMAELRDAVALAATYDEWIVFEEAVVGREIEVAVIGNRSPRASLPGEIVPGKEFYDYEDKYVTDGATLRIPADLDAAHTSAVRDLAVRAYESIHCEGLARVDFFFEEHGRGFLLNEINTIPGFTPISMYPKMWDATGLAYPDLISELVDHAIERHRRRKRTVTR